jgi:hypothetical protein
VPTSVYGDYLISFSGQALITLQPPQLVLNTTFDAATWTTSGVLTLPPDASVPGVALGFFNSKRNASAPVGSGITNLQLLQPGYSPAQAAAELFTAASAAAVAPFHHVRVMEWTRTNNVPQVYPATVEWSQRRSMTDALWVDSAGGKPLAVGTPWETALLLSRAAGNVSVWVNVPVYATGAAADNATSYIYQLATLLRDGNEFTAGAGLAPGAAIYLEHGNELWLNTSSLNYAWNRAAAVAEVAAGGSPLNNDGVTDPEVWARRRHAKRLMEISAIFQAVFGSAALGSRVLPVYAWYQDYVDDAAAALAWLNTTYGPPVSFFTGLAVNAYRVAYMPPGSTENDVLSELLAVSDASVPGRQACAALAASYGLRLMTYEGSGAPIPAGPVDANATLATEILAARSQGAAEQQSYDYAVNWVPLGGAEYNFYALAGQYDQYQWGLLEDLSNITTSKYQGAMALLAEHAGALRTAAAAPRNEEPAATAVDRG